MSAVIQCPNCNGAAYRDYVREMIVCDACGYAGVDFSARDVPVAVSQVSTGADAKATLESGKVGSRGEAEAKAEAKAKAKAKAWEAGEFAREDSASDGVPGGEFLDMSPSIRPLPDAKSLEELERQLADVAEDQVTESASDYQCPLCQAELAKTAIEEHDLDYCRACKGMFMLMPRFNTLAELLRSRPGHEATLLPPRDESRKDRGLKCPSCARPMLSHAYGGAGNIYIDTCSNCMLIWLDPGELARVVLGGVSAAGRTTSIIDDWAPPIYSIYEDRGFFEPEPQPKRWDDESEPSSWLDFLGPRSR